MSINDNDTQHSRSDTTIINCYNCHSTVGDVWCNVCEKNYCSKCGRIVHTATEMKNHHSIPINQKMSQTTRVDEKTRMIEAIETGLQRAQLFFDRNLIQVNQMTQLINAATNVTEAAIRESFVSLRTLIDEREKTLQQELHTIARENKKLIEDYHHYLKSKQQILHKQTNEFAYILKNNDQNQLLQAKNTLTEYLEKITEELPQLKESINTQYRIEGIDQFKTSLNDILKPIRIIQEKGGITVLPNKSSLSPESLDCNGNACHNCGYCRDWIHTGQNWYRAPGTTCDDYRYWHYIIYRHPPAFQRGIGDSIIRHNFHRGIGG